MNQSQKLLVINLGQFRQEELDSVLRKILNRKVAGLDEIPPEVCTWLQRVIAAENLTTCEGYESIRHADTNNVILLP